jgi:polyisoprenoid-binding protein YceI
MTRSMTFWGLLAASVLAPAAARAAPIPIAPPASHLGYTVFAMGLVPINASFQDFAGTLIVDPARPADCAVQVTVRMASLHMADPIRNRLALGASMLDAARYPTMHFDGHCEGQSLVGALTLHGVTRPLTLALQRDGTHVTATGMLQRRDYAIAGMPGLIGQRVRLHLDAHLPQAAATP